MLNLSRCYNHNYSRFIAVLYYKFYCSFAFGYTSLGLFYLRGETPHLDELTPVIDFDDISGRDSHIQPQGVFLLDTESDDNRVIDSHIQSQLVFVLD